MENTTNFTVELIEAFKSLNKEITSNGNSRYLSWEHCYKEFESAFSKINDLKDKDYLNLSLNLAFYLASWGMYRGSSFLLQFDYKVHFEVVKLILKEEYKSLQGYYWKKDDKNYNQNLNLLFGSKDSEGLVNLIRNHYKPFREKIKENDKKTKQGISDILVTKILLGTLGCVPAYDRMIKRALEFGKDEYSKENKINFIQTFGKKSFENLIEFYLSQQSILENNRQNMTFEDSSLITYPQMKFLDMCFWQLGLEKLNKDQEQKKAQKDIDERR